MGKLRRHQQKEARHGQRVDFSNQGLTSLAKTLPSGSDVTWLKASGNAITDIKPLRNLPNLQVLNLQRNKLAGVVGLHGFSNLRALILNDNNIQELKGLGQLPHLNTLVVKNNKITSFGDWLQGCTSLVKLSAANNGLLELGDSLSSCTSIAELRLNSNPIRELPKSLCRNAQLQILDVGKSLISEFKSIKVLKKLQILENLNLTGSPLSQRDGYRDRVLAMVPGLSILDAHPVQPPQHPPQGPGVQKARAPIGPGSPQGDRADVHPVAITGGRAAGSKAGAKGPQELSDVPAHVLRVGKDPKASASREDLREREQERSGEPCSPGEAVVESVPPVWPDAKANGRGPRAGVLGALDERNEVGDKRKRREGAGQDGRLRKARKGEFDVHSNEVPEKSAPSLRDADDHSRGSNRGAVLPDARQMPTTKRRRSIEELERAGHKEPGDAEEELEPTKRAKKQKHANAKLESPAKGCGASEEELPLEDTRAAAPPPGKARGRDGGGRVGSLNRGRESTEPEGEDAGEKPGPPPLRVVVEVAKESQARRRKGGGARGSAAVQLLTSGWDPQWTLEVGTGGRDGRTAWDKWP
eukprot:jgi/Botrbrau1/8288/Bobra.0251s0017.1